MRHQIFISSYRKDFEWLIHCLRSLDRFAHGFLPPVVCVDSSDQTGAMEVIAEAQSNAMVAIRDGEGFMRAQISMMEADLLCPEAEIIHLVGSDCLAFRDFTGDLYCHHGKPVVLMNSYAVLAEAHSGACCWRRGVERVLGFEPDYEYMRRLPSVFPAEIFPPMRAHVERLHGKPFADYIVDGNKARRDTSEANILGAYAHRFMFDSCEWVNLDSPQYTWNYNPAQHPVAIGQFWSHGGLDRPSDSAFAYQSTTGTHHNSNGRTPREIIRDVLGEC